MNISENKRVVALSAVFALAFGGVMFYGYGESQKHASNKEKIAELRDRFDTYINKEMPPTKQNLKEIKTAFSEVAATRADMQAEMNRYAEKCMGEGKKISALEFQEKLKQSRDDLQKLASSNAVALSGSAAELGMETHRKAAPVADNVPFLDFQRRAVQQVSEIIMSSGASAFSKVFCHALPEEAAEAMDPSSRKAEPYFPLGFEVEFEAKRGSLPAVINSIVKDKDYFLTITGIAVEGQDRIPGLDPYKEPGAAAEAGSDLGAEEGEAEQAPAVETVAVRKLGGPDEKVRVYMTLQVLYFTPGKTK